MADGGEQRDWFLDGNFAPVTREVEAFDLKVEGALPRELTGTYMRIGPNPKSGHSAHWFLGDGMVHGMRLEGGRAAWYRNRYVQTTRLTQPRDRMEAVFDLSASTANTNIVRHNGRLLALEEAHFPYEVTPDLATRGPVDFDGKLKGAFTAHPKFCPATGEMLAFGYGFMPPYLTYYRADASGRLVQAEEIPVTGPTMIHDFCVTATRVIFMDLPIVFDIEIAMAGGMPFKWSDDYPARLGVMPRNGTAKDLRWYDIPPCYVFHPLNAFDDGDKIVFDVARYERLWDKGWKDSRARLTRWVIDPASSRVSQDQLYDMPLEFPRCADAKAGFKNRYGYAAMTMDDDSVDFAGASRVLKFDLESGAHKSFDFGAGHHVGEFVHAAAADVAEDAGWIMGLVHDDSANKTSLAVLDAADMNLVARVALPQRVPYGFHGNWFAD